MGYNVMMLVSRSEKWDKMSWGWLVGQEWDILP